MSLQIHVERAWGEPMGWLLTAHDFEILVKFSFLIEDYTNVFTLRENLELGTYDLCILSSRRLYFNRKFTFEK